MSQSSKLRQTRENMTIHAEKVLIHRVTSDRRLIEEALPLKELSLEAAKEKNIHHGHINTLHIWWARRPLVACRAAILGCLLKDPTEGEDRKKLLDFMVRLCTWESTDNQKLMKEARQLISENRLASPKILDCFSGGGAIPLEALRLGCDAHSLELNSVAVLIELCTLVYPQRYGKPLELTSEQTNLRGENKQVLPNRLTHDVERWANWMLEEARKEIGKFYKADAKGRVPTAFIWARTLTCPNPACGVQIPLLRQLWLSRKAKKRVALRLLPDRDYNRVKFEIVHGGAIKFDPKVGTVKRGSVECPVCHQGTLKASEIRALGRAGKLGEQLVAIVLKSEGKGKSYRIADDEDKKLFEAAKLQLQKLLSASPENRALLPEEPLPPVGSLGIRVNNYGLIKWGQLFNPRQALAIITFIRKLREINETLSAQEPDEEYRRAISTYLAFVIDKISDFDSSLSRWANHMEKSVATFGRQALPMLWDYCEVNPFAESTGSWKILLEWTLRSIDQCFGLSPATVRQGTATNLSYENEYFDAVITDPPYYDSVPYSDLSDFFYVWLKRSVGRLYPKLFETPLSPKTQEIIQNPIFKVDGGTKDREFFEREMTKALKEMNRVLKPDGICAVVFAHKTTTAWETLIAALLQAGFKVTASWPMHTERPGRLRAHDSAVLASSVWLICRKRPEHANIGSWKEVQRELDERIKERLDYFLAQGIKGADALLSAIGPAVEVFGKYERVEKVTGDPVKTSEFLDKVREVVAHHALSSVLSEQELGNVDPPTAFYVLWKWTFELGVRPTNTGGKTNGNHILVPFDEALKLAHSVGADQAALVKMQLVKQEKEYVRMLGPNERKRVPQLGEASRDGRTPATIDIIHRALNLWAAMEQAQLEEYLDKSGARNSETFWRVAQALSNLLPLQSKEKQLLDGLLARYAGAGEVVRPREIRSLDEFVENEKKGELK